MAAKRMITTTHLVIAAVTCLNIVCFLWNLDWFAEPPVNDENDFIEMAHYCTDKTTTHRYQDIYPSILHRYRHSNKKFKLLEIGLGCDMGCVAGGMRLLRSYLPNVEYHVFEFQMDICRERYRESHVRKREQDYIELHLCEGSSADTAALSACGERFGPFDIIIDDASHRSVPTQIAFKYLFSSQYLRPGGVYIIEDLQTQFDKGFMDDEEKLDESMAVQIADMVRWKMNLNPQGGMQAGEGLVPAAVDKDTRHLAWLAKSITCVSEACAFEKITVEPTTHYPQGFPKIWKIPELPARDANSP